MRLIYLILCSIFLFGCSQAEKGTLDTNILSKKVFETIKEGDIDRYRLLIPGKSEFARLYDLKKQDKSMMDEEYQQMRDAQANQFREFRSTLAEWDKTEYANTQGDAVKLENVAETSVVTKIRINGQVEKYQFTARKLNGRWFVTSDISWVSRSL
jgi:hypothetical protein